MERDAIQANRIPLQRPVPDQLNGRNVSLAQISRPRSPKQVTSSTPAGPRVTPPLITPPPAVLATLIVAQEAAVYSLVMFLPITENSQRSLLAFKVRARSILNHESWNVSRSRLSVVG